MMEEEVVRRRAWLTREAFLDLLGAVNLIPGPNSTELAIFIGYRLASWRGLLAAGLCFIMPASLLVGGLACVYVRFGLLPDVQSLMYGIKPVVIAIVLHALCSVGKTVIQQWRTAAIAGLAAAASFAGVQELLVLVFAGLVAVGLPWVRNRKLGVLPPLVLAHALPVGASVAPAGFSLWSLFLFFLKVGSVLYGSGYVLLAFLRADLVQRWHWLTEAQLLDAVAVGQFTPGPVFTTATFIGYLLGGTPGAALATAGIFLPSFVLVGISGFIIPYLRRSVMAAAFLDGVNAASLALMAVVCIQLGRAALVDTLTVLLGVASAFVLFRFRINSAWLILAGALAGWIRYQF
jgi:chromate transporter